MMSRVHIYGTKERMEDHIYIFFNKAKMIQISGAARTSYDINP